MTRLSRTRDDCRFCGSGDLAVCVQLQPLPVASPNVGAQAKVQETAPADLYRCLDCGALQLTTIVDPEFQYRTFKYVTSVSAGLSQHFGRLIDELGDRGAIGLGTFVFDIGSNDGSLLRLAAALGARVLGIDPAVETAAAATAAGIPTIGEFFGRTIGGRIRDEHGPADVIVTANTIANIDDLDDFFAGVDALLAPDGLLVIETQYALDVLDKTLLDVIYHEHLSYFSVHPLIGFLKRHGFRLADVQRIAPKGGSIRFHVRRDDNRTQLPETVSALRDLEMSTGLYGPELYDGFNRRISALAARLRDRLDASRERAGRALAYGSSVGCAALVHHLDLGDHLDAVFDDSPFVNYMRRPGGTIPVLSGAQLANEAATDVAVLAWRYAEAIAGKQTAFRAAGGRFYAVLPDIRVVGGQGEDQTRQSSG